MNNLVKHNGNYFPAIPSLLDELLNRSWMDSSLISWKQNLSTLPSVNVKEDEESLVIEVAAPGMNRENFHVEFDNHVLTISGQREEKKDNSKEQHTYNRREFNYQSFQRSFTLPEGKVKAEEIAAVYKDGILQISIPKSDNAKRKPIRQISIG